MAEIWGAAIMVGGAVISGVAKSKQEKEARKNANADSKAANKDEAKWGSIMSQFEKEQDYRYEQIGRQNKQRGLDEFRKFSTLGQFAPEYAQTNQGIVVPEARTVSDITTEYDASEARNNPEVAKASGGGKNLLDKIDPLGAALGKKDPVRNAIKKLF